MTDYMNKLTYPLLLAAALLSACTPAEPDTPTSAPVPTGVKLVSADASSLTFTWDEVKNAEYYIALLETPYGEQVPGCRTSVRPNTITFKHLTANTAYVFKVASKVGDFLSDFSEPVRAGTGQEGDTPDDPGDEPDNPQPDPTPGEDAPKDYSAFQIPPHEDSHGRTLAFPGAEGGGMYTAGGRGGKVIHVTNLNDSGAGSLRDALNQKGPRTIVFDVAGIIELKSNLGISNGDVTIAGQTAPGDGICLKNYSTQVKANNVIIRFVRFRLGDQMPAADAEGADAVWGRYNDNLILDHCSMSWSMDECASFYANRNFTMQWCILTESLKASNHVKGTHGYGGIWGGKDASFHHNMLANHDSRNPRFCHPQVYGSYVETHRGHMDYRNNVVFNWGDNSSYGGEGGWYNMVNNYYKPGEASKDRKYFLDVYAYYAKDGKVYAESYPDLYLSGNVHEKHADITADNKTGLYWHKSNGTTDYPNHGKTLSSPLSIKGPSGEEVYTMTQSARDAYELVLEIGGASLRRDAVDERACNDAKTGKATFPDGGNGSRGGLVDTPSAVGGWPSYEATAAEKAAAKDSDGDGMPDWFEDHFGLDKEKTEDGNGKTLDIKGRYTNLEMYLHYLVREVVAKQAENGIYEKMP